MKLHWYRFTNRHLETYYYSMEMRNNMLVYDVFVGTSNTYMVYHWLLDSK
jgi:hypothetical protein